MTVVEILAAIAGLAVLILLHELGHFAAARAVGVKVERFSLFFGPALLKREIGGVEWKLGSIPLGGYVRVAGLRRPEVDFFRQLAGRLPEGDGERLLRLTKDLDSVHSAQGAEGVVADVERLVARQDLPEAERARAQVYLEDARERIFPGAWWLAWPSRKLFVLLAGPAVNIALAFVLLTTAFMIGASGEPSTTLQTVQPGSPAAQAGLVPGDRVLAVDGRPVDFDGLTQAISRAQGESLELTVATEAGQREATLTPYREDGRWLLGITVSTERVHYGLGDSIGKSVGVMTGATSATAAVTADLAQGSKEASDKLVGPIGVVQISAQSLDADPRTFLGVLALLSLSLALLNLLPIPPLDGGQSLIALSEMARRRRMSQQTEAALMLAGFGVVFVLIMVGLGNDLTGVGQG